MSSGWSHRNQEALAATAAKRAANIHNWEGSTRILPADLARLRRAIPKDTRSLTGRMLGDPLPGRSALDEKRRAAL